MTTRNILASALALGAALGASTTAAGDGWMIRAGVHNVDPKSDNGSLLGGAADVTVDSSIGPTVNIDYYLTPNLAVDILGALPFKHDISLNGAKAGSTQQLPPTVSLQYHFMPGAPIDPYVAAGLNYTLFWEDKLDGEGAPGLELDPSFGLAAQIGADIKLDKAGKWVAGVDLRYIDIDSDATVGGSAAGTVNIDPLAYGVNIGYRIK